MTKIDSQHQRYQLLSHHTRPAKGKHALALAVGSDVKGKLSLAIYVVSVPLAFVNPWISISLFVVVAAMWLVPDRRIETRTK